ncbi:hypothetical protein HU200_036807 [Digitaria exilis]|uniref:GBF-interacting protein 1 N-terminal domain-containing protein n=1 Tax=Digitaria exilis TaxID=1010633 RepID=A0A835EJI3_9POAL|nr:hypothetical protein HU200_036807 [Digitaria exilis]
MSGGGGGGGRGVAGPVPASARKLVQGLKEIVNRPDAEIYAALRECGMDPDEAVSRLLSQDTFQEVKSKRDKKKEVKETPEPRSRGAGSSNSRATRGGADRAGRSSSVQFGSNYMVSRSSILGPAVPASNSTQKQSVLSLPANKDVVPNGSVGAPQSSSGFQHPWCGVPGQMSMADIVKMGRPQVRSSAKPMSDSKHSASTALPTAFDQGFPALPDPIPQNVNSSHVSAETKQVHENDWFPQDEPPSGTQSRGIEKSSDTSSATPFNSSVLVSDAAYSQENSETEENSSVIVKPAISSETHLEILEENNQFNDGLLSTHQAQVHSYVDNEVEVSNLDAESAAANFQHLSLQNEDLVPTKSAEDNPAVILPDHLQAANADCAHLSFGSFESGAFSGLLSSNVPKSSLEEEVPIPDESPSVDQIDVRNQDYYDNSALNPPADEVETRIGTNLETIDGPSVSEPDVLRQSALDVPGLQYNLPSVSGHAYSNTTQPSTMDDTQGNTQAQPLSHFSSLLSFLQQPNNLLGSNLTPLRDFDFSQLLQTQSATKYNPTVAPNSLPGISMQETLKQGGFPNTQSTQHVPNTSIPSGLPVPQQLPVHPYSQPTLPLGPFASLVGYPYLPQNYFLPSAAFQQAYSSNGPFHQSAAPAVPGAGMKYSMPQYKSSPPASSLPQPSSLSGYGGFGNANNIPGNLSLNQGAPSAPTTLGFDEALGTQFKDPNHYAALQQSDNSAMWLHGAAAGSRGAAPPGNFYGFPGQNQQGGFRQTQQSSQYGGLGYPSFYQSQTGLPQEHPQNPTEGSLNNPQAAPSQPSHQLWQHSY